jgi:hypothetical protein
MAGQRRNTSSTSPASPRNLEEAIEQLCQIAAEQARASITLRFTLSAYERPKGGYKYVKGGIWAVELQARKGSGAALARRIETKMVDVQRLLVSGL